jgi:hypothetical protein
MAENKTPASKWMLGSVIGAPGFEPGTSCSRSRRANRAALRPVYSTKSVSGNCKNVSGKRDGSGRSDGSGGGPSRDNPLTAYASLSRLRCLASCALRDSNPQPFDP